MDTQRATCAFLVVVLPDGTAFAGPADTPFLADREATLNDMYGGCAQVMKDIEVMQTTQAVVQNVLNAQMQVAQTAMQAQHEQKLVQQILTPNHRH